ncbi:ThiF family adenylyltransferase [Ekhidna sp.]|uniref:ThiF family adenylyltransferase n=1 Tax=Ekhidna sp. TaxID=2608089 RepID=UPI0035172B1E
MSHQLISRSKDLKRLQDEGFEIQVRDGYLIVHSIPYVNSNREIKLGKLIAQLSIANEQVSKPVTHVIHFMGEMPCNKDGTPILGIQHGNPNTKLFDDVTMNYSFSNKPKNGYSDHYQQVTRYEEIISASAISMKPNLTSRTFKKMQEEYAGAFKYFDTNASRANILPFLRQFNEQRIGIVGVGGTGSYVLDLMAKVPVKEIHLYDGDLMRQHNAYRSPGAAREDELDVPKVEYFGDIYSRMHTGIVQHPYFIDESNLADLKDKSIVFLCVDNNDVRKLIINYLKEHGVTVIDIGLGLNKVNNSLIGTIRVTTIDATHSDHVEKRVPLEEPGENEYAPNIQIVELNAFGAAMAIIRWKKLLSFYQDLEREYNATYTINVSQLQNDECDVESDEDDEIAA